MPRTLTLRQYLYLNRKLKAWCAEQGWHLKIKLDRRLFLSGRAYDHDWLVIASTCRGDAGGGDATFWDVSYTIKNLDMPGFSFVMVARKAYENRSQPTKDCQTYLLSRHDPSTESVSLSTLMDDGTDFLRNWRAIGPVRIIVDLNLTGGIDARQLQSVILSHDTFSLRYFAHGVEDRAFTLARAAQNAINLCSRWCDIERARNQHLTGS